MSRTDERDGESNADAVLCPNVCDCPTQQQVKQAAMRSSSVVRHTELRQDGMSRASSKAAGMGCKWFEGLRAARHGQ